MASRLGLALARGFAASRAARVVAGPRWAPAQAAKEAWIGGRGGAAVRRLSDGAGGDQSPQVVEMNHRVVCSLKITDPTSGKVLVNTEDEGGSPVTFMVGQGQVIPGLENRMEGMRKGESWTAILEPKEAFGFRLEERVIKIPLRLHPESGDVVEKVPEAGQIVQLTDGSFGRVVGVADNKVEIDTNHEFADRSIEVAVTLLDIEADSTAFSGVQVKTLSPGDGITVPKNGDQVAVHYVGMLASDGKVFDKSSPGRPIEFKLGAGRVIRGWDEGIARLTLGERARLFIASDFAYGAEGAGNGLIPPNANLVFEVELVKVNGIEAPTASP